jgi:hypothetical protein
VSPSGSPHRCPALLAEVRWHMLLASSPGSILQPTPARCGSAVWSAQPFLSPCRWANYWYVCGLLGPLEPLDGDPIIDTILTIKSSRHLMKFCNQPPDALISKQRIIASSIRHRHHRSERRQGKNSVDAAPPGQSHHACQCRPTRPVTSRLPGAAPLVQWSMFDVCRQGGRKH